MPLLGRSNFVRIFLGVAGISLTALLVGCGGGGGAVPTSLAQLTPMGVHTFTGVKSFGFSTPPPQPTLDAYGEEIDFDHPSGLVRWNGPDDRVSTEGNFHCGAAPELKETFRLPDVVLVRDNPGLHGYYSPSLEDRQDEWVWTGYYRGDWQLWQGSEPAIVYLVHSSRPDVGFAYHAHGCD